MSFEKISREGFDYVNLKCYIEGNKFCVAVGGDPSYAIYTIEIDEIKEYLNRDIAEQICGT